MSTSSNEQLLTPLTAGKKNGRSASADSKMKNKPAKSPKGLMKIFKRDKAKENGVVPVRPSCFNDDFVRRPDSPDSPSRGPAVTKAKGKEEHRAYGLWRPKGKCEWESDSGRMLTLKDIEMRHLSKVELLAFQRVAINQLQAMNLAVSHALVSASKKGRLSFNSFNKRRVSGGPEQASAIFGQPIDKIATDQLQGRPGSGSGGGSGSATPVSSHRLWGSISSASGSSSGGLQPPSSPTNSDTFLLDNEPNPTAVLLEALSKTDKATAPPSPKTQRQLALIPSEPRVPPIVRKAIDFLDQTAVKTEGLFRISGSKARIHEIRRRFDKGQDVDLSDANPHDVASVLKEFFRSLPEPLMTRDLYGPILSTRKLSSSAQRRDALRLLCLLLPPANRDTLQELLEFLSRVALHSDGIILIDGTEETGNRMTEQNLGLIIGPNILHKERRVGGKLDYQVMKQDQEELTAVCKVMEDLIRMHLSVFTIPAALYDLAVRHLQSTDPEAVDTLLKRKCMERGLYNPSDISRSRSSEAIRRIIAPGDTSTLRLVVPPQSASWRRSRSLSDTEKTLDEAIRELDSLQININDDLEVARRHRHYSSNDSAMGESELVMSPVPSASSEPSTLTRARHIYRNRSDSAFSNNTSPTNSSNEGMNSSDMTSLESDPTFIHLRNASTVSATSEPDRQRTDSSPAMRPTLEHPTSDSVSLPAFSPERDISPKPRDHSVPNLASRSSTLNSHTRKAVSTEKTKSRQGKKWKLRTMPSVTSSGTYSPQRSPVLESKGFRFSSEALHEGSMNSSTNPTPTPHAYNHHDDTSSQCAAASVGSNTSFISDEGTVI